MLNQSEFGVQASERLHPADRTQASCLQRCSTFYAGRDGRAPHAGCVRSD